MRHSLIALIITLGLGAPVFAQTGASVPAPANPVAPTPPATPAVPSAAEPIAAEPTAPVPPIAGKTSVKEIRATCRDTAKAGGLRGDPLRKAVSGCVVKERPELAGREQCRLDGFAKGLRKEELRAFVKDCAKGKV